MSVVPDYPDYAPHVAHAQQIAKTGVPLLHAKNLLDTANSVSIASGTTFGGTFSAVTQTSYLIMAQLAIPATATVPFAQVILKWIDSASLAFISQDTYIVPASSNGQSFAVHGSGPAKADTLRVVIGNMDPAQTLTASYTTWQTSRVVPRDDWRWTNFIDGLCAVPGFTLPTLPDDESVLGMLGGVSIPGSSSSQFLFGMHNGLIQAGCDQGLGAWSNLVIAIAAMPAGAYVPNNPIYGAQSPPAAFQIAGPRAPLRVTITNKATTAQAINFSMIRAD